MFSREHLGSPGGFNTACNTKDPKLTRNLSLSSPSLHAAGQSPLRCGRDAGSGRLVRVNEDCVVAPVPCRRRPVRARLPLGAGAALAVGFVLARWPRLGAVAALAAAGMQAVQATQPPERRDDHELHLPRLPVVGPGAGGQGTVILSRFVGLFLLNLPCTDEDDTV